MNPWTITTTEWSLVYPVQPSTPIGTIRLQGTDYWAWCAEEALGVFPSGDAAAEAIWERFLEQNRVRHDQASHTHGAYERHVRTVEA